jgi:hypothetical protein
MKKNSISKVMIAFTTFIIFLGSSYAQCDEAAAKKNAKKFLNPYQLESLVTRPLKEVPGDKSKIQAEFFVYEKEDYKFVNLSTGFSQTVHFEIYDQARKLIYSSEKSAGGDASSFSFIASTSGSYTIEFKVAQQDLNSNGCITFAIGYAL